MYGRCQLRDNDDACKDDNECTEDTCNNNRCLHIDKPIGTQCKEGKCDGHGFCKPVTTIAEITSQTPASTPTPECTYDEECDDCNECSIGKCKAGKCHYHPIGGERECKLEPGEIGYGDPCYFGRCVHRECVSVFDLHKNKACSGSSSSSSSSSDSEIEQEHEEEEAAVTEKSKSASSKSKSKTTVKSVSEESESILQSESESERDRGSDRESDISIENSEWSRHKPAVCGNSKVEGDEECDGDAQNSLLAFCGDDCLEHTRAWGVVLLIFILLCVVLVLCALLVAVRKTQKSGKRKKVVSLD